MSSQASGVSDGKVSGAVFLKDVFICSLGAYGGPEAHMSVFLDQMVVKRKYLTEEELVELIALCSILPGPTSTQTIVAIGYKVGGAVLALMTMLVWAMPAIAVMTLLSFLYAFMADHRISADSLRFISPMAVGFISLAAIRIGRKVVSGRMTWILLVVAGVTTVCIRSPWLFPLLLFGGGVASIVFSGEKGVWNRVRLSPPWRYLIVFVVLALGSLVLSMHYHSQLAILWEGFYRYGYLVFGGGQVVVPLMYSELVETRHYMTGEEFLTGYGLVQGLPGPMFSFAAYAGGMAARGGSAMFQILGALVGGIGIFLPGLLLIYFVYPVWEEVKQIRAVKISLTGVNAVAGGMIAAAAVILIQADGISFINLAVALTTALLLATRKIPAPLIVLLALAAGFLL